MQDEKQYKVMYTIGEPETCETDDIQDAVLYCARMHYLCPDRKPWVFSADLRPLSRFFLIPLTQDISWSMEIEVRNLIKFEEDMEAMSNE